MTPFIVAEMSANHLGSFERACKIVLAAADAGADAIKLQCWTRGAMVGDPRMRIKTGPWAGQYMDALYDEAYTPWVWFEPLMAKAKSRGIELFAAAFDKPSVAFLEDLDVRRHKIASFELVDHELIRCAADTGKPLILSTGMATYDEIQDAVAVSGTENLTLLHCVSAYPAPPEEANLLRLKGLAAMGFPVGISDHTLGSAVAVASVGLGARYIEKHLTLRRYDGGPDAAFSMEPEEFAQMVKDCRTASKALGRIQYGPQPSEMPQLALRRSLWWASNLPAGSEVPREAIMSARPADGLPCARLPELLGRKLARDVWKCRPLIEEDFA